MLTSYDTSSTVEIGVDEAGRGPMLGRVYCGAVILPKDGSFRHDWMKDSKRFHSEKKIKKVAEYIKENAIAWAVAYATEQEIDKLNIRCATHKAMHEAIRAVADHSSNNKYHLLIDGNDFKPYSVLSIDDNTTMPEQVLHTCIEGGDNTYTSIAAASILAKVARDEYIDELCMRNPTLDERYGIQSNKGYGTKNHMDGIRTYGISEFHRKTFGICKDFV